MCDSQLSDLLAADIYAQLTRDADRAYRIEIALRKTMPPMARLVLQRERSALMAGQ